MRIIKQIFPFILIIVLNACTSMEKNKISQLYCVDSLNWEENTNYVLSTCLAMETFDEKLFVLDGESINVFNNNTMKYLYSISKKGKGPGEIFFAQDLCFFKDQLVVADPVNSRIQYFDLNGNYLKSLKLQTPWRCFTYNDNLYTHTISQYPSFTVYKVLEDSTQIVYNFDNIINDDTQKNEESFFLKGNYEDYVVYRKNGGNYFYRLLDENLTKLEMPDIISGMNITGITNAVFKNEKYYVIATSYNTFSTDKELTSEKQRKIKLGVKEYLLVFNNNFEFERAFLFPLNILSSANTLAITSDYIFVRNHYSDVIYKLKMEN